MLRGDVREEGPTDPWYKAFVRQRHEGAVPDLSPAQAAYLNAQIQSVRNKAKEDYLASANKEAVRNELRRLRSDPAMHTAGPAVSDREVEAELQNRANAAADAVQPELWWANPEAKAVVLAQPERFKKTGLFETTTPFGETVETPASWLFRAALTVPNAFAGWASNVLAEHGPLSEEHEQVLSEERRKAREQDQPALKDSPVLYNIARNRGFAGEAIEAGNILQDKGIVGPAGKVAIIGAGFIADFLDPSLPAIAGGAEAVKTGAQAAKATKALRGSAKASTVAGRAAKAGAAEFLDLWLPVKLPNSLKPGDLRTNLAADLANSQSARLHAIQLAEEGQDLPVIRTALKERFGDNSYVKALDELPADADVQAIKNIGLKGKEASLAHEIDDYVSDLNKIIDGEKIGSPAVRMKDLARDMGAAAATRPDVRKVIQETAGTLVQKARALKEADLVDPVIAQHIFSKSLSTVFEATPNMRGLQHVVQVTPNTWAVAGSQKKILNYVKDKTEAGKLAQELVQEKVPIISVSTPRGVETYYDFSKHPELLAKYDKLRTELQDLERISLGRINIGPGSVAAYQPSGLHSVYPKLRRTKEFRSMLDATIDSVAEGQQVRAGKVVGEGIVRARDAKALASGRQ